MSADFTPRQYKIFCQYQELFKALGPDHRIQEFLRTEMPYDCVLKGLLTLDQIRDLGMMPPNILSRHSGPPFQAHQVFKALLMLTARQEGAIRYLEHLMEIFRVDAATSSEIDQALLDIKNTPHVPYPPANSTDYDMIG